MTSEILVMNKGAISLAADSAVTIDGVKVRTGVEKLFKLSDDPPMGMMIFGNANFDNIPMETLIKEYSKKTDFKKLKNIGVIQNDFLEYLGSVTHQFNFKKIIDENFKSYIENLEEKFNNISKKEFNEFIDDVDVDDSLEFVKDIVEFKQIGYLIKEVIHDFVLNDEIDDVLHVLMIDFFKMIVPSSTGVVITGFNDENLFPSFISFDLIVNNAGKIEFNLLESKINYPLGHIVPFAQRDVIDTFLTGSSLFIKEIFSYYFVQFLENYGDLIVEAISSNGNIEESSKKECIDMIFKIKSINAITISQFADLFEKWDDVFMTPILSAINTLPKNELADMAYSLVNITSLRRKIDSDIESVGGDVAVAIITKGDGFIWLNKINQIDMRLNPHILNNG